MSDDVIQDQNTAKLVMNTFYRLSNKNGVTAAEIAKYLQDRYGDVWRVSALIAKAQETLRRSSLLGFLEKRGNRYVANMVRDPRFRKRRRCKRLKRRRNRCSCTELRNRRCSGRD